MPDVAEHSPVVRERQRVLIVEDAEVIATLVQHFLAGTYAVTWAATAEQAMEEAAKQPFDVVLCNLTLGLSSDAPTGRDVCRELRMLPTYRDVRIIALSGYLGRGAYKPHVLSDEFDAWLGKPFSRADLLRTLEGVERRVA